MSDRPTNVYHWGVLANETELADECKQHGYILTKFIHPTGSDESYDGYYLLPEGANKISGYIAVGSKRSWWHVFDGTFDEFLESLATYEERYLKWYGDQLKVLQFDGTPTVNVHNGEETGVRSE